MSVVTLAEGALEETVVRMANNTEISDSALIGLKSWMGNPELMMNLSVELQFTLDVRFRNGLLEAWRIG